MHRARENAKRSRAAGPRFDGSGKEAVKAAIARGAARGRDGPRKKILSKRRNAMFSIGR